MMRNRVLSAAMAAVSALGVAGAVAAAAEDGGHRQRRGAHAERENGVETVAVLGARIAPADAVAAAERAAGGRAAKLSTENEHGTPFYEVRVAAAGRMVAVKIDPATGAVRGTERDGLLARVFDREDWAGIQALLKAPTTLGQAIAAAERAAGGGRAVEAAWEGEDRANGFEVDVAKDGGAVSKMFVDAASGRARPASPEHGGEH